MWQYDANHDSILTAGNGGTKPVQALLTLYCNQGQGQYQMRQTLAPSDQMWVDVGDLIGEHIPYINGNFLPTGVTQGSYDLRELGTGIGTLYEGKVVYDKTYGEATYGCMVCCGYKASFINLDFNPFDIPVTFQEDQSVLARDTCSGSWVDITGDFYNTWSTTGPSIATVDASGTHTGVAPGSTITYTGPIDELVQQKVGDCPISPEGPSGNDNVITCDFSLVPSSGDISATYCDALTDNNQTWAVNINYPNDCPIVVSGSTCSFTGAGSRATRRGRPKRSSTSLTTSWEA